MTIAVLPFAAGLGADVRGVDIRRRFTAFERDAIRGAWLNHLVLRFRDQPMTDEQHMAFTGQFGELEFNPAALIEKQYGVNTQADGRRKEVPPMPECISDCTSLTVASSRIALRYEEGRPPVLAVRIQELFGLTETPCVAGGRVRVLLHLLAPNYRPQQACCDRSKSRRKAAPPIFSTCIRLMRLCPTISRRASPE